MRQLWGIRAWGVLLILLGGLSSLITFFEIIDSIRFYGLASILIISLSSLAGFVVYGFTPIFLYTTGVGLFMSRLWARSAAVGLIPALLFLFFFTQALHVAKLLTFGSFAPLELVIIRHDIFLKFLTVYLFFILPLVYYFSCPSIRKYFRSLE